MLDEIVISQAIIDRYFKKLMNHLQLDVAIAGAGPAGLTAAYFLAKEKAKVAVFEKKLSIGGGMWGGGMMFNEIVVQETGKTILDEFGINTERYQDNYFTADAVEAASTLTSKAVQAGAKIFNCVSVEDVKLTDDKVSGLVINWSPVEIAGLHVDPLTIGAKFVIESTGHPLELLHIIEKKSGGSLFTATGKIMGEKSMNAEIAETTTLENTKEIFPNVYVTGMAANAAFGSYRMGPIFGGMLLSGKKVAELILHRLRTS
ncbi:MAG: thiazole biosynthesis protein [Deltaproteobacteria bacterium]|nr:thiazole biosynthesis protein [Deltaproteobacteria bacterium]